MSNQTEIKLPQSMIDFIDLPEIVNNKIDISVGFLNGDIDQPQFINTFTFIFYQAWLNQQTEIERLNRELLLFHGWKKIAESNADKMRNYSKQLSSLKQKVSEHNEKHNWCMVITACGKDGACPTCPKHNMIDMGEHHE